MDKITSYLGLLDKDALVAALMDGTGLPTALRHVIPCMPSDAVQMSTTGKVGERNIIEAVDFCQAVMDRYRMHSSKAQPAVLDFGCGWGRITRTFLSETAADRITGADVRANAVELARSLAPTINFTLIDPRPPRRLSAMRRSI